MGLRRLGGGMDEASCSSTVQHSELALDLLSLGDKGFIFQKTSAICKHKHTKL